MFNTDIRKQMIPKKAREAQETQSHGICDTKSLGMAKLRMKKKLGKGYKVHLDFILTAMRH